MTAVDRMDPAADGTAHRQLLMGLLGSDDPEQVQAATPGRLRALVAEAGSDLRTRPAESEWSERARYGLHRERGPESYEMTFRLIAGHDWFHIDQAQAALATLATVRSRR